MILDDIADRAGLIVECAATPYPKILSHRNLDVVDVVAIPDRFEKHVGKPEVRKVLHRFLTEVMIDTKDRIFSEGVEKAWGNGQIMERAVRAADHVLQTPVRRRILIVAGDIAQERRHFCERCLVNPSMMFDPVARSRQELVVRERTPGDTDDRNVQPAANRCLKRRNNLVVREITSGTEEYERVGAVSHISSN